MAPMSIFEAIVNHFNEHLDASSRSIETLTPYIAEAAHLFAHTLLEDKKVLCCTSGTALAVGSQFCNNLLGTTGLDRPSLPVQFLGANTANTLALLDSNQANESYARQIHAFGQPGDLLFIISSDNRENALIQAIAAAKERQLHLVSLTCGDASDIPALISNEHVNIPLLGVSHGQALSLQFVIVQMLSDLIEQQLFGGMVL